MRTNTILSILIAAAAFAAALPFAQAQDPETKESLEKKLKTQYPLTKLSADGKDVVTAGSVFTLKKDGLVLTPTDATDVSHNSYKAGKITQGATGKANEKANKVKSVFGHFPLPGASSTAAAPTNATRTFVEGEKVNITKIEVKDGSVVFDLCSAKAYSDVYYHGSLTFPVDKGTVPAADAILATSGEVFSVDPPGAAAAQTGASDLAAPQATSTQPPAPPQMTREIELGQTIDQVVALLGPPVTTARAGEKEIYLFKDWKITFINGRVADIDVR
jgi:hypothetical protein